jgi:adenylate kinase
MLGPPGSGKGTQAKLLCDRFAMTHISTGNILREAVRDRTELGRKAEPYMKNGGLVPDALVNAMVVEGFERPDRPDAFLLDGYPRTLNQAAALDTVLRKLGATISAVLVLRVPDEEIVRRVTGRRICPKDQSSYHVLYDPPKEPGVCDHCHAKLIQREDDREEKVKNRLAEYHATVDGLLDFYRKKQLLREVNGLGSIQEVFASCLAGLERGDG